MWYATDYYGKVLLEYPEDDPTPLLQHLASLPLDSTDVLMAQIGIQAFNTYVGHVRVPTAELLGIAPDDRAQLASVALTAVTFTRGRLEGELRRWLYRGDTLLAEYNYSGADAMPLIPAHLNAIERDYEAILTKLDEIKAALRELTLDLS